MLEYFIANYGYWALFIGTFFEGETILIIAGIAASEGLLDINYAILFAFAGSVLGDTTYFLIGRKRGDWILQRIPSWRPRIEMVLERLERHSHWLILTFRFMYGLRNFASVAVGMSRTPAKLFIPLNAVGAALWALSFGWGGYLFGEVMIAVVKDVKTHQMHILGIGCLVLLVFWGVRFFLRRRKRRKSQSL
jgi:membrane protein DedA with SNARE-associated domain